VLACQQIKQVTGALGFGMSDDTVFDTGGVLGINFFLLLVLLDFSDMTVVAATGVAADVVTGVLVGARMSDDAVSNTDGIFDADLSSLLILFVFSGTTVADAVTGALVGFEKSDDAISSNSSEN
jgi:hypothetical protein